MTNDHYDICQFPFMFLSLGSQASQFPFNFIGSGLLVLAVLVSVWSSLVGLILHQFPSVPFKPKTALSVKNLKNTSIRGVLSRSGAEIWTLEQELKVLLIVR
jgi:hypothetical protein